MSKGKIVLMALLVMVLWGSLFPMVKLGYRVYDIVTTGDILLFAGIRFTVCGTVICLFSLITDRKSMHLNKSSLAPVLLTGLFAIILHYSFTYTGLSITDSSKTAILKQIGMLFYVCFSFLFFKDDRLTVKKFVAAVMGFAGIVAINAGADGISFNMGDLLITLASFCSVFASVVSKKTVGKVKPVALTGVSQLFGGVVLLGIGMILGGSMDFSLSYAYVLVYICVASIFSYCIWYTTVQSGDLSNLFIIKFAEPVFACLFGALILGEDILKLRYLVAFLLIAGGIVVCNSKKRNAAGLQSK